MKLNPAKILVQDYLELNSITLGFSEWTDEHFKDNPPRLLRLQRIRACLSCLEIEVDDFHSFEKGEYELGYIENWVLDRYVEMIKK